MFARLCFLALLAACVPDPDPEAGQAGARSEETGSCGPLATLAVAEVSCSSPPVAWRARDVEVYDGAMLFEADGEIIAATGSCVAIKADR